MCTQSQGSPKDPCCQCCAFDARPSSIGFVSEDGLATARQLRKFQGMRLLSWSVARLLCQLVVVAVTRKHDELKHELHTVTWFWHLQVDISITVEWIRVAQNIDLKTTASFLKIPLAVTDGNLRGLSLARVRPEYVLVRPTCMCDHTQNCLLHKTSD